MIRNTMNACFIKNIICLGQSNAIRVFLPNCKYSQYGPQFVEPTPSLREQKFLKETGEAERLRHLPIKAANSDQSDSIYNDPIVKKFTNYLMRKGDKVLARTILEKAFEQVKRIQLEKYNNETDPAMKESIVVDPLEVFHRAVENCKPALKLSPIKRGGATYQVPTPITDRQASFLSMNWLIEAGREKDRAARWWIREAHEFVDASENKGRVIKRKQDLHKQCETNRAYAHYRWG